MGVASDHTLLYVPRAVEHTALGTPPFLEVAPYPDWDLNPLEKRLAEKGGILFDLRVPRGYLSKRRRFTGVVNMEDPEQRQAVLDVIRP